MVLTCRWLTAPCCIQAFDLAEKHLGIAPVMTGKEMATCEEVDHLVMVTYISQVGNNSDCAVQSEFALVYRASSVLRLRPLNPRLFLKNNKYRWGCIAEAFDGIISLFAVKHESTAWLIIFSFSLFAQFYEVFKNETPNGTGVFKNGSEILEPPEPSPVPKNPLSSTSPVGLLIRFTNHIKRKSVQVENILFYLVEQLLTWKCSSCTVSRGQSCLRARFDQF